MSLEVRANDISKAEVSTATKYPVLPRRTFETKNGVNQDANHAEVPSLKRSQSVIRPVCVYE